MKRLWLNLAGLAARWLPLSAKHALYRFGPIARLIRGSLNRAAPQELSEIGIAGGALAGARMLLDLQQEKDYWLGAYEADLQAALSRRILPGWVVYDAGANIGYITLLLARLVGERGQVHAFEALPENTERLRHNLALNTEGSWVHVVHAAVTAASSPVQFLIGPSDDTGKAAGSAGRQLNYETSITVPGISLDDYVFRQGQPAPQAIKMDIEGGEVLALPGMRRLLEEAKPLIFLELHGQEAAAAAWQALRLAGYHIYRLAQASREIQTLEELGWKEYLVASPT